MNEHSWADCFNLYNESFKAEYLVLNHPFYLRDVHVCRHHLVIMFDRFTHGSETKEITIVRLED